jgi:mannose-6-phosphate isomerase-like protein (cupin superfamily)
MAERKYEKYIMDELRMPAGGAERDKEHGYAERATRVMWLEDEIIKEASSVIISWYWKATEEEGSPSHVHDFDEILGFIGNDPDNPTDLGGEVEFWMEDEKYLLTKSCLIWVPAGLRHCPLRVASVKRPFLFLAFSMTQKYTKDGIILGKS